MRNTVTCLIRRGFNGNVPFAEWNGQLSDFFRVLAKVCGWPHGAIRCCRAARASRRRPGGASRPKGDIGAGTAPTAATEHRTVVLGRERHMRRRRRCASGMRTPEIRRRARGPQTRRRPQCIAIARSLQGVSVHSRCFATRNRHIFVYNHRRKFARAIHLPIVQVVFLADVTSPCDSPTILPTPTISSRVSAQQMRLRQICLENSFEDRFDKTSHCRRVVMQMQVMHCVKKRWT